MDQLLSRNLYKQSLKADHSYIAINYQERAISTKIINYYLNSVSNKAHIFAIKLPLHHCLLLLAPVTPTRQLQRSQRIIVQIAGVQFSSPFYDLRRRDSSERNFLRDKTARLIPGSLKQTLSGTFSAVLLRCASFASFCSISRVRSYCFISARGEH